MMVRQVVNVKSEQENNTKEKRGYSLPRKNKHRQQDTRKYPFQEREQRRHNMRRTVRRKLL